MRARRLSAFTPCATPLDSIMSEPMPPRLSRLLLGLALALVSACSGAEKPKDEKPSIADLPCSTQAECAPLNFVCDDVRRTCVCTSDEMCADKDGTPYCNAYTGRCVADIGGCKSDSECGSREFCDIALRTCRALKAYCESCSQDAECGGANDHCVRHPDFPGAPPFCALGCATNADCGNGQACRDTVKGKQCVPANGRCSGGVNEFCTPDLGATCRVDSDCPADSGQVCDQGSRTCIARDSGCRASQACDPETRKCVSACRFDSECQERYTEDFICVRNTCVQAETCFEDEDCDEGRFCFKESGAPSGLCRVSCDSSDDCPLAEICSHTPPRRCVAGCDSNADCRLTAVCRAGACATTDRNGAQHCQTKEVCDFREFCSNEACRTESKHCQAKPTSAACGAGGKLSSLAFPADRSGSSYSCPAGSIQASGNPTLCVADRCLYDCANDDECPNGFYCAALGAQQLCFPVNAKTCL